MNKFKLHLQDKLQSLTTILEKLNIKIETLPPEHEIKLDSIKKLKKEYHETNNSNILKRILGPSKQELRKYLRNKKLQKLEQNRDRLIAKIDELTIAIASINENQITEELENTNNIIIELLEYSINLNLTPPETTRLLLEIIRNSKQDDSLLSNMKTSLLNYYDKEGNIISTYNLNTLRLIYEKLFKLILSPQELQKYSIIINALTIEIYLKGPKKLSPQTKEQLTEQKESLGKLQTYIYNGEIVNTPDDIEEFRKTAESSGLELKAIEVLVEKMKDKIAENKRIERLTNAKEETSPYLTTDEIERLQKAIELEEQYTGDMQNLISRLINDIISICRYIKMIEETQDVSDSLEILTKRHNILKDLVKKLSEENNNQNAFYYLTDDDLIPYIYRTIEISDVTQLPDILNLLRRLSSCNKHKIAATIDEITIYKIETKNHIILYTIKDDRITIINAYSNVRAVNCTSLINEKQLTKLKEILEITSNPEYQKLNNAYENLLISSLTLNQGENNLTLFK